MKRITFLVLALAVALVCSTFAADRVVIDNAGTLLLPGPQKIQGNVIVGDTLQVLQRDRDWYKIKTRDGKTGWVYSTWVTFIPGKPPKAEKKITEAPPPVSPGKPAKAEKKVTEAPPTPVAPSQPTAMRVKVTRRAPLREKASIKSKLVQWLAPGTSLVVLQNLGEWYQVKVDKHTKGYLYAGSASVEDANGKTKVAPTQPLTQQPAGKEPAPPMTKAAPPQVQPPPTTSSEGEETMLNQPSSSTPSEPGKACHINVDRTLMRSTPGGRMLGMLVKDIEGTCGPTQDGWTQFTLPNGTTGWVETSAIGKGK